MALLIQAVLILAVLLQGCGFQPRGSISEISPGGKVFIDGTAGISLREGLEAEFMARAHGIAANRDEADVLLRLSAERQDERIVSIQRTGRVSELELRHAISYQVTRRRNEDRSLKPDPAATANRIEVTREYTYDKLRVLGKADEARILRDEMRAELVEQIVLRTLAGSALAVR